MAFITRLHFGHCTFILIWFKNHGTPIILLWYYFSVLLVEALFFHQSCYHVLPSLSLVVCFWSCCPGWMCLHDNQLKQTLYTGGKVLSKQLLYTKCLLKHKTIDTRFTVFLMELLQAITLSYEAHSSSSCRRRSSVSSDSADKEMSDHRGPRWCWN